MSFSNSNKVIKTLISLILSLILFAGCVHEGQNSVTSGLNDREISQDQEKGQPYDKSRRGKGPVEYSPDAFEGYTLFAPISSTVTYLIDMHGNAVKTWNSKYRPGHSAYLLENGDLLRTGQVPNAFFQGGGAGGRVQRISWQGELLWDFEFSGKEHLLHHDIELLPNGNVLMIAWELKSRQESIEAGRRGGLFSGGSLWPDMIIEVKPAGKTAGDIVWEWHFWDHLVQDIDPDKANYGSVADHPELLDINYVSKDGPGRGNPDWNHCNSIDYNERLDQIVISSRSMSEIYVIDHSTTTLEAKGHSGGRYGKGGDILYRWGNPKVYQRGGVKDQRLFEQHDAAWVEEGCPGEGNITIFNNGASRPGRYSSVDEITPPVDENGIYMIEKDSAFGPAESMWCYVAPRKSSFYADHISGSQRLPNGNTLICSGPDGLIFEVTPEGRTVWKYVNTFAGTGRSQGPAFSASREVFRAYRYAMDYPGILF